MTIKLYTSDAGIKNRLEGRRMVAFTQQDNTNNVEVTVNFEEIEQIHSNGLFEIKSK